MTESKGVEIIIECLLAHSERKLHKAAVAGVFGCFGEILAAVACMTPAFYALTVHDIAAVAVIGRIKIGNSAVDGRSQSQDLEGGSGFVCVGDDPVAGKCCKLVKTAARRIVWIIVGLCGDRLYRAGIDIHDDPLSILRVVYAQRFFKRIFQVALEYLINCKHDFCAVDWICIEFSRVGKGITLTVGLCGYRAVLSGQIYIERKLKAALTDIITGCETDDLRKQRTVWVIPLAVCQHSDAGQLE